MQLSSNTSEGRWAFLRLVLGLLQVFGAAFSLTLLVETGITPLSLGSAVVTGLCTTVSILLFGSRRSSSGANQNGEGWHGKS